MKFNSIEKIIVFRTLQIGDMLCSIPAIRALHYAYPTARITLACLPWAKMLVERFGTYLHSHIIFPGYPGFPEQPVNFRAFPHFLKQIQSENFDLALQMQGNGIISNPLVTLFDAKNIAGFFTKNNYCPNHDLFIEYPNDIHEINRHLKLVHSLGITETTTDLEFPILAKDEQDFSEAALPVQPKQYVIIHPGSRDAGRRWNPENFAAIADMCCQKGLQVIVTGTKDETEIVKKVVQLMRNPSVNAAGKTTLGAVAVLIKNAALLVSNCTGVSHIAAALKTKSIVISLDGEPYRWGPLNSHIHKTIDWTTQPFMSYVKEELEKLV